MKDFLRLMLIVNLIVLGLFYKEAHNKMVEGTYDCEYKLLKEKANLWMAFFPVIYLDDPQFVKDYCEHKLRSDGDEKGKTKR